MKAIRYSEGGALQLVDLAGADFDDRDLGSSTSATSSTSSTTSTISTSSTTAQQRKESIDINKSLLALKECFRKDGNKILCQKIKEFFRSVGTKGSKTPRACFRGSKLTRSDD